MLLTLTFYPVKVQLLCWKRG